MTVAFRRRCRDRHQVLTDLRRAPSAIEKNAIVAVAERPSDAAAPLL